MKVTMKIAGASLVAVACVLTVFAQAPAPAPAAAPARGGREVEARLKPGGLTRHRAVFTGPDAAVMETR